MPTPLKIDVVSDVSCPWCAVGLWSLQRALAELQGEVAAELHFQPFELNPKMGPGGQDIAEAGIRSVPAVVVNDRHLISGGQPVAVYVQDLRQIVAEPA